MGAEGEGAVLHAGPDVPAELFCYTQNVSYSHRVDNRGSYDWCTVPDSSYDVVLFGGLAVVLACLLQGKLNTLMVLVAGAVIMAIAWPVNLGALGNSLAIWLGISPWQLFFYVFLPPLLLDAGVRIDWYLFRKSVVQVFTLAFLVVGATCVAMIPIMLYILDLRKYGWNWIHACMFGAMIASTDAVAIVSIMKTSGGPRRLRVMLEGESLLNDASGLTLFEIFFHILEVSLAHPEDQGSVGAIVGQVFLAVVQFGLIGFVMGMVFGVLTRFILRYMRYLGASHDQEVALTLGMAYLAYWVTGQPCKGSGVVAVAVMGLYGAATNCWDMSTHAHSHFDGFWETLAFIVNSLVFLYSGASVVNFFIRASGDLTQFGTHANDLELTLWMLPIIYIILCLLRFILTMAFRPLFIAIKGDMTFKECIFICVAGLRGSASLIMGSAVVTHELGITTDAFSVVKAMMVFWTAGFVLLTLLINAPLLPTVLRLTGLSKVPDKQLARRQRAVAALREHTTSVLEQLRDAEDELLAGVDWAQVAAFVDHGRKYATFTGQRRHKHSKILRMLLKLQRCCCPWIPASWTKNLNRHAGPAVPHKGNTSGKPGPPSNHHSHHSRGGSSLGSGIGQLGSTSREMASINPRMDGSQMDLESGSTVAATSRGLADGYTGTAVTAAAADGVSELPGSKKSVRESSSLGSDGIHEQTGGTPAVDHVTQRRRNASKGMRSSKRATRKSKHQQASSGTASDDDSSSRSGGRSASERSSVSSSTDSEDDGLFHSVLPGIRTSEIDILMQECPFMGARYANQPKGNASSGAAAAAAAAGPGAGGTDAAASTRRGPNGLVSRFWAPRSKRTLLNQPHQQIDVELQQQQLEGEGEQQPLPPKVQPSSRATADQPTLPDTLPMSGDSSLSRGSAGAAAAAAQQTADSRSADHRPRSGGAAAGVRSLATRSAAPAFVYGSRMSAEGTGFPEPGERSGPHHARKSSNSATLVLPEGPPAAAAAGFSKPGSWGLAGMAMESAAAAAAGGAGPSGLLAEVEWSAGSPRSVIRSPFQIQTDKALGRQSGVTRGLATRSVNLGADRFGGGPSADSPHCSTQHPHLPEDAEAAMHVIQCEGGYDAAAAAVDMVSLARNSRKAGQAAAPTGGGGPARSRSRALASRSVGMPGAYQQQGRSSPTGNALYPHSGSDGDLHRKFASTGGYADSTQQQQQQPPAMRSLATRSQTPHMPPVAPAINPSLYTISTGLKAYTAYTEAAGSSGGGADSRSRERYGKNADPGTSKALAARSVPAAQAAAAMAAASAVRGRPSSPPAAAAAGGGGLGTLSFADQLGTISGVGPAPAAAAAAAAAAGGGLAKSSGGLLHSVKRGLDKMSVTLAKGSRLSRGASVSGVGVDDSEDESGYDSLYKGSVFGSSKGDAPNEEELADARHWLVSGLKRYFHSKRMEGLLSARGLRILDGSCEIALEDPRQPLALWCHIGRDVGNNILVRVITYALFLVRQTAIWLVSLGQWGSWMAWPLRLVASMLQRPLNNVLLASVEVAMEYLMGLTTSPYVEWLQEGEVWDALLSEIQCESAQVAKFLIDREIEAPERYSAVQSYRVAMAVLRQQKLFVESCFESGMLDNTEHLSLAHPIEAAERRLELLGPVWRAPSLREVLRQLPFMREQPDQVVDFLVRYGHLIMLTNWETLPDDRDLYVVQSGIIKVSYQPDLGEAQEYFLGAGGVYNLYAALTGEHLPGTTEAVAQGNALGKGPVLFCVSAKGLRQLSAAAAAGDATYQQLELDMNRLAGLFLLERLKPQLDIEVSQALARMAPLYHSSTTQRHSLDKTGVLDPNPIVSSTHRHGKRLSRQQRAAWVQQHMALLKHHLKQQLAKAELLVLPRGCSVAQESHVLLLQGSIQVKVNDEHIMSDQRTAETARWVTNAGRHQHQSILPWLWDILNDEDVKRMPTCVPAHPVPVVITAGLEGATLLVCPSAAEEAEAEAAAAAAANITPTKAASLLLPASPSPVPNVTAKLGPAALTGGAAAGAAAAGTEIGAAPNLARVSGGSTGSAAAAGGGGPAATGRAAQLVNRQQQNPLVRRSLAAAAAADSVMSPRPGTNLRQARSATAATAGSNQPPVAADGPVAASAADRLQSISRSLSRKSPTVRELGRVSPLRLGSISPLPGATEDNRQYIGTDMRHSGSLGQLDDQHAAVAAAAAVDATQPADGHTGNEASAAEGPAAAAAGIRRSKSQRPLKPWGSMRSRDT